MARSNLQIKIGTYTGDGADSRVLTGVGFQPDLFLTKGANNHSVFRTSSMIGDSTAYIANSAGNLADAIQQFTADGVILGTNAVANANGTVYHYIAIRGAAVQSHFRTGRYVGTGGDDRNFITGGVPFTPDLVFIKREGAATARFTTTAIGGSNAIGLNASTVAGNIIQSLIANGFQLGTDSTVNTSGDTYYFFALKELAGAIKCGSYTGNGVDGRSITGLGFTPDAVIVKSASGAVTGKLRTSTEVGDESLDFGSGVVAADCVQALEIDGFQLGTSSSVNSDTVVYYYVAFKSGNFNAPITRPAT